MTQDFESSQNNSCEPSLSRAEFIARVVKGAALTGGILAAPKILDKFLVPPAYAGASSSTCTVGTATVAGGADTVVDLGGPNLYVRCNVNSGLLSTCTANDDAAGLGTFCQ